MSFRENTSYINLIGGRLLRKFSSVRFKENPVVINLAMGFLRLSQFPRVRVRNADPCFELLQVKQGFQHLPINMDAGIEQSNRQVISTTEEGTYPASGIPIQCSSAWEQHQ